MVSSVMISPGPLVTSSPPLHQDRADIELGEEPPDLRSEGARPVPDGVDADRASVDESRRDAVLTISSVT
jgi:hypothetical protein